ncbi:anti-sigma factor family protein [Terricaulis silvestris]|uniref:Putative transmembrane transcriptional regulator (Anti-sigma factor) n=1 Tax=Terricaulis silvestris TaxID=2686094 RepID=A0A6I6MLU9_9CAUL|nr:hypothetical protein [Terricaulis silvestris]QGZ94991.1 putative transmembrane transcriptional regulator (anti-sigma factor) [Terricaulis silvestris]
MKLTDEELMAYADGEMPAMDAKRVEAAMAEDPPLAARVARFRAVRRALHTAYDSVLTEPVPERLRALLGDVAANEPPPVVDLAVHRDTRKARFGPPAWAAMAASLVVGVLVGHAVLPSNDLLVGDGRYAGADLARVLDTRLASDATNQSAATRIGLTFRANDGQVCRTFSHAAQAETTSGLACRENDRWAVQVAVHGDAQGEFRQAGADAPAILDAVDAMISGEPFDAEQERAGRESNWAVVP